MRRISPLILFLLMLIFIIALVSLGPSEESLGSNVRLVYLHGAWVWTALIGFAAAAVFGLAYLVLKREQVGVLPAAEHVDHASELGRALFRRATLAHGA